MLNSNNGLPNKKYFTIEEVSQYTRVSVDGLRYWERLIQELVPNKRNNKRYYRMADVELVCKVKQRLEMKGLGEQDVKALLTTPNISKPRLTAPQSSNTSAHSSGLINKAHSEPISKEKSKPKLHLKTQALLQQMRQDLAQFKQYIHNKY